MKLIIPVYFHDEESAMKRNNGLPYLLSECQIRKMILYSPPAIIKGIDDDGSEFSLVFSNGECFECPLKVDELDGLIMNHLVGVYN